MGTTTGASLVPSVPVMGCVESNTLSNQREEIQGKIKPGYRDRSMLQNFHFFLTDLSHKNHP